jgi:hypothetical protein
MDECFIAFEPDTRIPRLNRDSSVCVAERVVARRFYIGFRPAPGGPGGGSYAQSAVTARTRGSGGRGHGCAGSNRFRGARAGLNPARRGAGTTSTGAATSAGLLFRSTTDGTGGIRGDCSEPSVPAPPVRGTLGCSGRTSHGNVRVNQDCGFVFSPRKASPTTLGRSESKHDSRRSRHGCASQLRRGGGLQQRQYGFR